MHPLDVIVIGAGMAGLVAAREIRRSGATVLVIDKSRGLGGRMATRRLGDAVFDHGAQFFTARDPRFQALVEEMVAEGVATRWFGGDDTAEHVRFRGVPSMTGPAKWLARGLDVRSSALAKAIRAGEDSDLEVELEGGVVLQAQHVVVTAPAPQALALCRAGALPIEATVAALLEAIDFEPCFALMVVTDADTTRVPEPGFVEFAVGEGPVAWVADNRRKGVSPRSAVTVHASHAFSRDHFDLAPAQVERLLLDVAAPWLRGAVVESSLHRWRYALPIGKGGEACLASAALPIVFAGDAYGGGRVEGAVLSGWSAAEHLLRTMSLR
ncbi:hypothetical protein ASA1KI_36690 [Opitutales bacterium ASA1]|uniref:NAD(P)/FAD-dependent oxidoreductase n=1 Tax=Congregicoccus parvus TaxID=3081749 RepID=UPI002B29E95E|nr:hypothetical protein ASA1KI_36690 [Opitutales bacterium ASA1]